MPNTNDHLTNKMPKNSVEPALRRQAESIASGRLIPSAQLLESMSADDVRKILQELSVHQIELEMQNEELRRTQLELDNSRNQYFDFYDMAPVGYITVTQQGLIQHVNLTTATLLGIDRRNLSNLPMSRLIIKEQQDIYYFLHQRAIQTLETQQCDLQINKSDGSTFWANLIAVVARNEDGAQVLRIVMSDITKRKQESDLLRQAVANVEKADKAKSLFLAAASHDLRQPLSALSLYTGLLKNTCAPSEHKVVASMQVCIDGLNALLNDLLDLSKLQAGVIIPSMSDFPIAELFDKLNSVYAPEAASKGLRIRFVSHYQIGRTDLVLFMRILGNLLQNALRYTERGGILVACRKRQGKTWIEIWDTGIGIPTAQIGEIFEEFKQLGDGARNKGSGLGLAIVAKTVALLGLEINVRSKPGRGSVFAIELPPGQPMMAMPVTEPQTRSLRALHIALVEDNEIVREALIEVLQRFGHHVVATATKTELMAAIEKMSPDIVISDYRLTGGDTGYDVITAVRNRLGAELPAMIITGDTDPELLHSMKARGIAVMHKSLDLDTLQASLKDLTRQIS